MTPAEKLALVRRSYAAFTDGMDTDALLALYDPECEWRLGTMGAAFGAAAFHGHDGLRAWVAALDEGFEAFVVEIDEARITSADVLLLRSHSHARSRGTQIELAISVFWQEVAFRDDLILSIVQIEQPPSDWDAATPLDLGLTPDAGT
jgi:ketosteroid isomerase-like protein